VEVVHDANDEDGYRMRDWGKKVASHVAVGVLEGKMEEDREEVGTVHPVVDLDGEIRMSGQKMGAKEPEGDLNSSSPPI
jgi:hypothetical protein